MAGSCSLAISVACVNCLKLDAAVQPLRYGVFDRSPDKYGRYSVGFSAEELMLLQDGVEYLLIVVTARVKIVVQSRLMLSSELLAETGRSPLSKSA